MATVLGRIDWRATRDDEGHREYNIKFLVESFYADGPQSVTFAPGLPAVGAPWTYGNDNDFWAFCTPYLKIEPRVTEDPNNHWEIEYKFTTKPLSRCNTTTIENPLAEPDKISGSFRGGSRELFKDRNGNVVKTTSHEVAKAEVDYAFPSVVIEQNRIGLGLGVFAPMVNTVNSATLWGVGARKVRLTNVTWERKLWGVCTFYYTRRLEFDIDWDTFDRDDIPDKGRKMIRGKWSGDPPTYTKDTGVSVANATDFVQAVDPHLNPTENWLDSDGTPSDTPSFLATVEYYGESNFLTLGIPTTL